MNKRNVDIANALKRLASTGFTASEAVRNLGVAMRRVKNSVPTKKDWLDSWSKKTKRYES